MPFFQEIMDMVIPASFMIPKITFTGVEDLEAHITAFHTQMMISRGTDAMHSKLLWEHSQAQRSTGSSVFNIVQKAVHRQPGSPSHLFRSLLGKAILGRALE